MNINHLFALVIACAAQQAIAQSLPPLFDNPAVRDLRLGMAQREVESSFRVGFKEAGDLRVAGIGLGTAREPVTVVVDRRTMKVVRISATTPTAYTVDEVTPHIAGFTRVETIATGSLLHYVYGGFSTDLGEGKMLCTDTNRAFAYQSWTERDGVRKTVLAIVDLRWLDQQLSRSRSIQARTGQRFGHDVPTPCR
jgi:transposase-like protein